MSNSPQTITPLLVYTDLPTAQDFLVDAFGFAPGDVFRTPEGEPVHAEVSLGGMTIWLHRAAAEQHLAPAGELPAQSGGLAVVVADVDAHHRHATATGATIYSAPTNMPYGRREYGARDLEGHRWWFGTVTA
jgi:uncharacterized glyoxalase superfamily protein PhnB